MKPVISIILPVYNGEEFLAEAIDSILKQTYSNFELIIVNDCSTDKSLEIAKIYKRNDSRISIINNVSNKKLPASLNIGHLASIGKYITWTSDDNILKPDFIEILKHHLDNEDGEIVFANYDIILEDGTFKRSHITGPVTYLLFGNVIGAAFMYKSNVFSELKGFNVDFPILEDYDFWLRASMKFKFYHINKNIYKYRIHDGSLSSLFWNGKKVNKENEIITRNIFKNFCLENSFSNQTAKLLFKINQQNISFQCYMANYNKFREDIITYNRLVDNEKNNNSLKKLNLIIRNFFNNNIFEKNLTNFIWIIKYQRGVIFSNTYSFSKTFKLIKEFIFK